DPEPTLGGGPALGDPAVAAEPAVGMHRAGHPPAGVTSLSHLAARPIGSQVGYAAVERRRDDQVGRHRCTPGVSSATTCGFDHPSHNRSLRILSTWWSSTRTSSLVSSVPLRPSVPCCSSSSGSSLVSCSLMSRAP